MGGGGGGGGFPASHFVFCVLEIKMKQANFCLVFRDRSVSIPILYEYVQLPLLEHTQHSLLSSSDCLRHLRFVQTFLF